MADNTTLNPGTGGDLIASDDIAGVRHQRVKITLGADGVNDGDVSASNPVPVAGTFWQATQPVSIASWTGLTDAQLRAAAVPVSLASVPSHPVTGPLTDAELRATAVPVRTGNTSASIASATTSATGATFVALDAAACSEVEIVNTISAAVDIEVRRGGSGGTIVVPAGGSYCFTALSDASGLQVRRHDQSNTQVTFSYEVRA